jgi:hypothetical protein
MIQVVDTTTKTLAAKLASTDILYFNKGCHGLIKTVIMLKNGEIHWYCPESENEGVISEWQKTKWDNRRNK